MLANQRLVAADGYEVALFPLEYLYMTQDEGGDFSHLGTYNIDFVGYNGTSVITRAPLYAPVTMTLKSYMPQFNNGNGEIWESNNKVHLPNGNLDYFTIWVVHDNAPPYTTVGTSINQGTLFYRTGTYGQVTGDHVHICVGQGRNATLVRRDTGNADLSNRIHMWDGVFVNDTGIIQGYGHNWRTWTEPTPTPTEDERHFPYAVALNHWWPKMRK